MKNSQIDVLCSVHYSYDPHNAYYEVFSVEALDAASAKRQVERCSRSSRWRCDRKILAMRVWNAAEAGRYEEFVGKRVGYFIDRMKGGV